MSTAEPSLEVVVPVTQVAEANSAPTPRALPRRPPTWAEQVLGEMTLRRKIGQMIMPLVLGAFSPEGTEAHEREIAWIEEDAVGGVIISVGTPVDVAVKLNDLQMHSEYPLLVGADLEAGAGFRFRGALHSPTNIVLGGATAFPAAMAFGAVGDPAYAYEMGRITATEALAMGVHMPFAPVLDVNNNADNPIINIRSFGEDPAMVGEMGASFVRGVQENGAIATGKHFPGHGDTEIDSHLALPVIRVERERMDSVELAPFRSAIRAGMGGIMTGHIAVPALSGERVPATLSSAVLTDLLRGELGFSGVIFTDAMNMGAIDRRFPRGEAAVRAVIAGADVLLMPPNVTEAIDAIERAVQRGRISERRIEMSVTRLLRLKENFRLHENRLVPVERVPHIVGIPEHSDVAREVSERSLTLIRNGRRLLPLLGTRSARVMSVTFRPKNDMLASRYFDGELRDTYRRLTSTHLDEDTHEAVYDALLTRARRSNLVVVSVYSNFAGVVEMTEEFVDFVNQLSARRITHVVVSFGNPYLIRDFPDVQAYLLAWSGTAESQRAAANALFGGQAITGTSPIGISPFFERGDGQQLPPKGVLGGR